MFDQFNTVLLNESIGNDPKLLNGIKSQLVFFII